MTIVDSLINVSWLLRFHMCVPKLFKKQKNDQSQPRNSSLNDMKCHSAPCMFKKYEINC